MSRHFHTTRADRIAANIARQKNAEFLASRDSQNAAKAKERKDSVLTDEEIAALLRDAWKYPDVTGRPLATARAIEAAVIAMLEAQAALLVAQAEPVAWQERKMTLDGWTSWYDAGAKTAFGKGLGVSEVLGGIEVQWRPLYATPPAPTEQPAALFGDEDHVLVPRGLLGSACSVIDKKRDGAKTLAELRRYTVGDLSATHPTEQPREDAEDAAKLLEAAECVTAWLGYTFTANDPGVTADMQNLLDVCHAIGCRKEAAARAAQAQGEKGKE